MLSIARIAFYKISLLLSQKTRSMYLQKYIKLGIHNLTELTDLTNRIYFKEFMCNAEV